jgi:hypothetical protein
MLTIDSINVYLFNKVGYDGALLSFVLLNQLLSFLVAAVSAAEVM